VHDLAHGSNAPDLKRAVLRMTQARTNNSRSVQKGVTMPGRTIIFRTVFAVLMAVMLNVSALAVQRLEIHGGGRHLVQANGKPFFWMGDTNWRLYKLNRAQVNTYLDNRKAKKFNVIQGPVLLHNSIGIDFRNAYDATNTDPGNPNAAWFEHIDYIVNQANQRGMYVALVVTWGDTWDSFSSPSQARNFGKWLGQRYRSKNNVIWIVAGEYSIAGEDQNILEIWDALGEGLADGSDGRQLITIHGSFQEGRQSSSIHFHDASWLDFNMIHSSQSGDTGPGADNWNLVLDDLRARPKKPTIDGEANYEQFGGWDAFGVRRRAYWSVFAGAMGHTYGANGVWQSYRGGNDDSEGAPEDTWNTAMNYPGASDMKILRRLIESRPMLKRVNGSSMLVSDGGGTPEHIHVTRHSQGQYAMFYVPEPNSSFTVDMSKISGSKARAWWYRPSNGKATLIGTFSTNGERTFTTPNSGSDWVLVLDDRSRNFKVPGKGGPLS
jgi:hypothetical protein